MTAVDDSAKLDVLEAIGAALHLRGGKAGQSAQALQSAAEALLLMSNGLWSQASLVRAEPMGETSFAGLHPVLQAIVGMDQVVWETIARLRPKFAKAAKEKSGAGREFMLKAVVLAISTPGAAPVQPVSKGFSSSVDDEADAKSSAETFYRNYLKYRPAKLKTQADVAKAAGISIGTVAAIERMGSKPHQGTVAKVAKAFGVSVEDMLA